VFRIRKEQMAVLAREVVGRQFAANLSERGFKVVREDTTCDLRITDDLGHTTRLTLDDRGHPQRLTTPLGRKFELTLDRHRRLTHFTDAHGLPVKFVYDSAHRPISVSRGWPEPHKLAYDQSGNLAEVQYPNGTVTRLAYSGHGMLQRFTDRVGATEQYEHDGLKRLTAIVDPNGNRTKFACGEWLSPDRVTYADGTFESFDYDPAGRLQAVSINGSPCLHYEHNNAGRVERLRCPDGPDVLFEYEASGNLRKATNGAHTVEYVYDGQGRRSKEIQDGEAVAYEYDAMSQLTGITLPTGERITYRYDADGRLQEIEDWDGRKHQLQYLDQGRVVEHTYPNGVITRTRFAPQGRPAEITTRSPRAGTVLSRQYQYNSEELLVRCVDSQQGERRYLYDGEERLLSVAGEGGREEETFRYDAAGNQVESNGCRLRYNCLNQLVQRGATTYHYDERGNLVAESGPEENIRYTYNGRNQLVAIIRGDGTRISFTYDPFGRRVTKVANGVTTRFIWASNQLLSETVEGPTAGQVRRDYLFMPHVYVPVSSRQGKVSRYYHCDHLGTPCRLTDDAGRVIWSATYSAFGTASTSRRETDNPLRFQGQYHDVETGLHYNFARYYSPVLGRYLSRDPLSYRGGLNFYLYAENNPVNNADPLGLLSLTPGWLKHAISFVAAGAAGLAAGMLASALGPGAVVVGGAVAGFVFNFCESYMTDGCVGCAFTSALKGAVVGAAAAVPFALLGPGASYIMFAGAGLASGEIGYIVNWAMPGGPKWDTDAFLMSALVGGLLGPVAKYVGSRLPNGRAPLWGTGKTPPVKQPPGPLSREQLDHIAGTFKEHFGQEPDAIHLVGSHAEGAATPKSDIDLVLETEIPNLDKKSGPGFEFFKAINPGKVPDGVTGIGPNQGQAFIGSGPGQIPKAGTIDPFFKPASEITNTAERPAIKVWPDE
jgi:RHS repeat-associated protein